MEEVELLESTPVLMNRVDMRSSAEVSYIINDEPTIVDSVVANIKYVPIDGEKKAIFQSEVLTKTPNLPKLKESLRKDVFDFFDAQLTNSINRRFKSSNSLIKVVGDNPIPYNITIEDYSIDYNALLSEARTDDSIRFVVNNNNIVTNVSDVVKKYVLDHLVDVDGVTALVYITELSVVRTPKINIPDNGYLNQGKSLIVSDVLHELLPNTGISEDTVINDLVVFTDNGEYILSDTYLGNVSIRKMSTNEYFEYFKI